MNETDKISRTLSRLLDTKQKMSEKTSALLSKEISKFDKYENNKTNVDERDYKRVLPSIKTMKLTVEEYSEEIITSSPDSFEKALDLSTKEMIFLRSLYSNSNLLSSKTKTESLKSELDRFCGVVSGVLEQNKQWMETLCKNTIETLEGNEKHKKIVESCKSTLALFSKEKSENVTKSQWKRIGIIVLKILGVYAAIAGTILVAHKGYEYRIRKSEEKYGTTI